QHAFYLGWITRLNDVQFVWGRSQHVGQLARKPARKSMGVQEPPTAAVMSQNGGCQDNIGTAYNPNRPVPFQPVIPKLALTPPTMALSLDGPMAKSQDTETLGARIARLRREKCLTQAELAQRLQVSQLVVSDYEHD